MVQQFAKYDEESKTIIVLDFGKHNKKSYTRGATQADCDNLNKENDNNPDIIARAFNCACADDWDFVYYPEGDL